MPGCTVYICADMQLDRGMRLIHTPGGHFQFREFRTKLLESKFHQVYFELPLRGPQATEHNTLRSGDLLVSHVHEVGQRLERVS
jgi:hypothetical protein